MRPTIYLETTIIGYLAMRVSGLLRVAANQQTTRDWWENHRQRFDLFVSRFVVDECADGDRVAAQERLLYLHGIPLVKISDDVTSLAASLVAGVPLPQKAVIDALHISAAAVNGVEYLLTWNCRHIANPSNGILAGRNFSAQMQGQFHLGDDRFNDAGTGDFIPLWVEDGDLPIGALLKGRNFKIDIYPAVIRTGLSTKFLYADFLRGKWNGVRVLKEDIHLIQRIGLRRYI